MYSYFWSIPIFSFISSPINIVESTNSMERVTGQILQRGTLFCSFIMHEFFGRAIIIMILGLMFHTCKDIFTLSFFKGIGMFAGVFIAGLMLYYFIVTVVVLFASGVANMLKTIFEPCLFAFTSSSTMPSAIKSASTLSKNPNNPKAIIPITIGVQQIGDCITNATLFLILIKQFHGSFPDLLAWFDFTLI